jgi:hypothetical protein
VVLGHAGEHHSPAVVVASTPTTRRRARHVTLALHCVGLSSLSGAINVLATASYARRSLYTSISINLYTWSLTSIPCPGSIEGPLASEESSYQGGGTPYPVTLNLISLIPNIPEPLLLTKYLCP